MDDPMFSSRTDYELCRTYDGIIVAARQRGLTIERVKPNGREHLLKLVKDAHQQLEEFQVPQGSPGLRRLRNSPQAETIRLATVADNKRKLESVMETQTPETAAPAVKKKAAKKAAAPKKVAKAAKKAAPKKAAKKAGNGERAPRLTFAEDAIITVPKALLDANPRREGSEAHTRLEAVRKAHGKTVKQYLAKGGVNQTLINATKEHGVKVK